MEKETGMKIKQIIIEFENGDKLLISNWYTGEEIGAFIRNLCDENLTIIDKRILLIKKHLKKK